MYASIWKKYFPVIRILMKKTVHSEQILDFSSVDFERIGKGRKAGHKFNIQFIQGKLISNLSNNELAASLVTELMEDHTTKALLFQNNYEFSFNTRFQLYIKNTGKHGDQSEEKIDTEQTLSP